MAEEILDSPRFPEDISYGSTGGPGYNTDVVTVNSGFEVRNVNWTQTRHTYNVAFGIRTQDYLNTLIEFFHAVKGKAYGFRYKDWSDYRSSNTDSIGYTDQVIGIGDDSNRDFQITKKYISGYVTTRDINKIVSGTLLVAVDGVPVIAYTLSSTGLIQFSAAPGIDEVVTCGFEFDVPVRFDTDTLSLNLEMYEHGSTDVPLVELRI